MSKKKMDFNSSLNLEMDRSIQLLDEAFSPLNKSAAAAIKKSKMHQRKIPLDHHQDLPSSFSPNLNQSKLNLLQISLNTSEFKRTLQAEETTTSILLKNPDIPEDTSKRLFSDFLETFKLHGSQQHIFEVITDFVESCSDTLDALHQLEQKVVSLGSISKLKSELINERNTWRLLYCLYQNRLNKEEDMETDMQIETTVPKERMSEKNIVNYFFKIDSSIREAQMVIDWLEQSKLDEVNDQPKIEHFTDKTVAWENTIHQLLNKSVPYASSRPIVSAIDPDAPLRENKPLHDLDQEDEVRLMKQLYLEVRCGRLEQAQTLCLRCGQPWRAATFEGWRLFHDPNYERFSTEKRDNILPIEGNPNRDIWKICAWRMCGDNRVDGHSRASYAAFCGHLPSMLSVCQSWEDMLWAYLRSAVDIRVEHEIRETALRSYANMPEEYWNNNLSLEEIFNELSSSRDPKISSQATKPIYLVQKYLIMEQIAELMTEAEQWVENKDCSPHFLRFLSHLVLFFRIIGRMELEHIGDKILEAYVQILMEMGDANLVAHYVAALPAHMQTQSFAHFLQTRMLSVSKEAERRQCLTAAEEAGLDVHAITRQLVENVRSTPEQIQTNELADIVSDSDAAKISTLDWVVFYPSQRAEALWQTNALIRHFLASGKLLAAKQAFAKVPPDSIELLLEPYQQPNFSLRSLSPDSYPYRVRRAVREYFCHKAYIIYNYCVHLTNCLAHTRPAGVQQFLLTEGPRQQNAHDGFSEWFQEYHHGKPAPTTSTSAKSQTEISFSQRVAFEHEHNQHLIKLQIWKKRIMQQTKTLKMQLYNVLTFPDGGWLSDSPNDFHEEDQDEECSEEDCHRQLQMAHLRKICIPKIVTLFQTVTHLMEDYAECVQLADLIANENYKLYKVFSKQKLSEFLNKTCESFVIMKKETWGLPLET